MMVMVTIVVVMTVMVMTVMVTIVMMVMMVMMVPAPVGRWTDGWTHGVTDRQTNTHPHTTIQPHNKHNHTIR